MIKRFAILLTTACLISAAVSKQPSASGLGARSQQSASAGSSKDVVATGVANYRNGDYEQAYAAFQQLLQLQDGVVAPEIRMNAALCALRLLHSRDAEALVTTLVDDGEWSAQATFLLGMAASQQAERAVAAASLTDAEPMAWMMATRAIRTAELHFRMVVKLAPEWPEASRNLERILHQKAAIAAARDAAKPPDAKKENLPQPEPENKTDDQQVPEVVIPEVAATQLTPQELAALQRLVREQQLKKLSSRQQRARPSNRADRRDW